MDKKAEKEIEIEIKLRPESENVGSGEDSHPDLVVSDSELFRMESGTQTSEPSVVANSAKGDLSPLADPQQKGKAKNPINSSPWFKRPGYVGVFTLTFLILFFGGIGYFMQWYVKAPRHEMPSTLFTTPALLTGTVGAPDAAYSLLLLPEVVDLVDEESITPAQKANHDKHLTLGLANLNKFLAHANSADQPMSVLTKCTLLCKNGEAGEAARLFRPLAEKYASPLLKLYAGAFLMLSGDLHEAIEQYDKGAALAKMGKGSINSSTYYQFWTMKAEVLQAMGRPSDALSVLESPDLSEYISSVSTDTLLKNKASVYLQLNQPDKAIVAACQMKKLDRFILSAAYLISGDYREALNQAGDSDLSLSRYYSSLGKFEEALKHAETADRDSHTVVTREQVVYVLNQMGRYKEALALSQNISAFSQLRAIPGDWIAILVLRADRAYALAKSGEARSALEEASKVLKNNPFSRTALEAARLSYATLGDRAAEQMFAKRIEELKNKSDFRPLPFGDTYPKL